ncbi:MAG: anthranilate phosphoribosyltransferase [Thermoanaerobaculia bacterium]|nr:anthranilate phosphoribosyltransferase [Thermoanaerobaculia bacterium]
MSQPERLLQRLLDREDLRREEVAALFGRIMDGEVAESQIAAILVALAMKGETIDEIAGAVEAMRARARNVPHAVDGVIDTCGTGGDARGTFNISTAAAIVAAAAGAAVAKHGNRAVSSRSGSADLLVALGLPIEVAPETSGRQLEAIGIAFLFAPAHHPATRAVVPVRRALGVRTIFNLLGPLTNPAAARRQLIGVYARDRVEPVAQVLAALGCEHALVVHGDDGLDEITTTSITHVAEVQRGTVATYHFSPESAGVRRAAPESLAGGSPEENATRLLELLEGAAGPLADIVALNAGAALYVSGRATTIAEGVEMARVVLGSGAAHAKLQALKSFQ